VDLVDRWDSLGWELGEGRAECISESGPLAEKNAIARVVMVNEEEGHRVARELPPILPPSSSIITTVLVFVFRFHLASSPSLFGARLPYIGLKIPRGALNDARHETSYRQWHIQAQFD